MPDTVEELETQLTALRRARAEGVSSYSISTSQGSRQMSYRTDADMAAAIADLERRLAALTRPRRRFLTLTIDRGL